MDLKTLGRLGALAMGGTAGIHRLWRGHDVPTWVLGSFVAAGMGVGFVLSRTVGLPGFHEAEWEPSGLLTLALEAVFVGAALVALPRLLESERRTAV